MGYYYGGMFYYYYCALLAPASATFYYKNYDIRVGYLNYKLSVLLLYTPKSLGTPLLLVWVTCARYSYSNYYAYRATY